MAVVSGAMWLGSGGLALALILCRGNLIHPAVSVSGLIALYSFLGIWLADVSGALGPLDFEQSLLIKAAWFGVGAMLAYLAGYGLMAQAGGGRYAPALPGRFPVWLVLLFFMIGVFGGILAMKVMAGSISVFVNNLHMRQFWARGVSWTLFLLIPIKIAVFMQYHQYLLRGGVLRAVMLVTMVVFVTAWLSLIGGRLFGMMMILQLLLIYLVFGRWKGGVLA